MPISQKNYRGDANFEATSGEMNDGDDNRDGIAEAMAINPPINTPNSFTTTGSASNQH